MADEQWQKNNERIEKLIEKKLKKIHQLNDGEIQSLGVRLSWLLDEDPEMPEKQLWVEAVELTIEGLNANLEERFNEIKNR